MSLNTTASSSKLGTFLTALVGCYRVLESRMGLAGLPHLRLRARTCDHIAVGDRRLHLVEEAAGAAILQGASCRDGGGVGRGGPMTADPARSAQSSRTRPDFAAIPLGPGPDACMRPCKVFRPDRTKMFNVKHGSLLSKDARGGQPAET
jgi:hypothetical protein